MQEQIIPQEQNETMEAINTESKEPPTNLMDALDRIVDFVHNFMFDTAMVMNLDEELTYVSERQNISKMQAFFLAILFDEGQFMTTKDIAKELSCTNIKVMSYKSELDDLAKRRFISHCTILGKNTKAYCITKECFEAFLENKTFAPKPLTGLNNNEFFIECLDIFNRIQGEVRHHLDKTEFGIDCDMACCLLRELVKSNLHLNIASKLNGYDIDDDDFMVLTYICTKLYSTDYPMVTYRELEKLFLSPVESTEFIRSCENGTNKLFKDKVIEMGIGTFYDNDGIQLSRHGKEVFLDGLINLELNTNECRRGLIWSEKIQEKQLFYNEAEKKDVDRLATMLSEERIHEIQKQLRENNLRQGFACLFYGGPGTGKTETVLQLARATGRDIYQVNISQIKDKFVGESEKNVKQIFDRYRRYCNECEKMPILLLNEADALIGKRFDSPKQSVDQMLNTMQNIFLQEIEDLSGILIATTNLQANMDPAFERRFMFKIEFGKPSAEARTSILQSMIPTLNRDLAADLAERYELSGGQIENVARKFIVDKILFDEDSAYSKLEEYCAKEFGAFCKKMETNTRKKVIGFVA
ncbi:MAG: ATP-binding protein [Bacteroidaceae bacterium]|nr:ATP-binding protein [Bacteroidaceae bacterium]